MKWFAVVLCLLFLSIIPASADSLVGPAYDVTGSVVFTGNNACGGVCMETVDFSFTFQWVNTTGTFGPGIYGSYVPGSFSATQFGSMGSAPISLTNDGHITCCGPGAYVALGAFNGELDLSMSFFSNGPDPGSPVVYEAFLYTCSGNCFTQFAPRTGVGSPYPATFTAVATPEPASAALLTGTMLCFISIAPFLRRAKRQGN